ncbi:hypothetical protein I302_100974 [Kwoniella bestiolae CBS 10118]|uniref:Uncharacterized protein n=1 Tax=Kwoniella bestiolae CBS 10118 TaxID=1296100 RepID=A0A1B9G6J7_9TREE|nr:hypothetical protein I302_04351 [Kwoniella bestiolae CBS 10118]OCF26664.1 hypothetical protein I302_04351 [Kwoniella bestiolae CBS 10118]
MPTSSPSTTTLPRPRSSPSLHTGTHHTQSQTNKMKRDLSFTPTPRAAQPPPIMVALAGWPEPIYVSSLASAAGASERRGSTGMGFEPLSSGQVYDGVATSTSSSPAIPISLINDSHLPNPSKKIKSRPGTPPPPSSSTIYHTIPSSSPPIMPTSTTSTSSETSPVSMSPGLTGPTNSNSDKPIIPASIQNKLKLKPKVKTNPIPNIVPTPITAPNLSIFATVCPHLTDPSLGPCPFKSHPHDVRNMFPPTSHLSPTSSSSPLGVSVSVGSSSSPPLSDEALSSPELEKTLENRNPQGLTNYFPIPGAGAPKPRSRTVARLNPKGSSSSSSTSSGSGSGSGRKKGSTFNDPRYGAILHKGRALPVVPSWDTTPVNNGFPVNGAGKGKEKERLDDTMDVDHKVKDEEDVVNSGELQSIGNGTGVKMEVE